MFVYTPSNPGLALTTAGTLHPPLSAIERNISLDKPRPTPTHLTTPTRDSTFTPTSPNEPSRAMSSLIQSRMEPFSKR